MLRPRAPAVIGISAALAVGLAAAPTRAQTPLDISSPTPSPPAFGGMEQAVVTRYWELGRPRPFLATTVEAGYAYVRPQFAVGYGQPFWRWVGLEAYPLVSLGGVGAYAGVAAALPGIYARAGARYQYPFSRSLLPPQESYSRIDIEELDGPTADYLALQVELIGTIPVFVGSLFVVLTGIRTELTEEGYFLYEESLRAVMEPPYIGRARLGYQVGFGRDGAIRVGAAGEAIALPGRDELVVRAGLLGSVLVNARLEAQASFIPALVSPDNLGLAGGDFGQLGVRFRWATGSTPDPRRVKRVLERKARDAAPRVQPGAQ